MGYLFKYFSLLEYYFELCLFYLHPLFRNTTRALNKVLVYLFTQSRTYVYLFETEGSITILRETATGPYFQTHESSTHCPCCYFNIHPNFTFHQLLCLASEHFHLPLSNFYEFLCSHTRSITSAHLTIHDSITTIMSGEKQKSFRYLLPIVFKLLLFPSNLGLKFFFATLLHNTRGQCSSLSASEKVSYPSRATKLLFCVLNTVK